MISLIPSGWAAISNRTLYATAAVSTAGATASGSPAQDAEDFVGEGQRIQRLFALQLFQRHTRDLMGFWMGAVLDAKRRCPASSITPLPLAIGWANIMVINRRNLSRSRVVRYASHCARRMRISPRMIAAHVSSANNLPFLPGSS